MKSDPAVFRSRLQRAISNAARYGRGAEENRPLKIAITLDDSIPLALTIADDGVGLAHAVPSVGSGQGVLLHSTMMAIIGGAWNSGDETAGTCIKLTLPEVPTDLINQ